MGNEPGRKPPKWRLNTSMLVLIFSLLGIPISRVCSLLQDYYDSFVLFAIGTGVLFALILLVALRDGIRNTDPIYFVFVLCTFSSVVDLLIGLENDGVISGYVDFYLKNGEPYLRSAYGIHICYWDGTVHYALYIRMLFALANKEDCRPTAIFWLGSFINSLIVFLPGNFLGHYPIKWSMLLNVPYVIIPIYAGMRFLPRPDSASDSAEISSSSSQQFGSDQKSVSGDQLHQSGKPSQGKARRNIEKDASVSVVNERVLDYSCIVFLISSVILAFIRALGSLGCPHDPFRWYVDNIEPQLQTGFVAYPRLQSLAYLYYYVPYFCFAIATFLKFPSHSNARDPAANSRNRLLFEVSLFVAGGVAQAQFSHIGSALHSSTPPGDRIPYDANARLVFWLVNLGIVFGQFIITYRAHARLQLHQKTKLN